MLISIEFTLPAFDRCIIVIIHCTYKYRNNEDWYRYRMSNENFP